MKSYRQYTEQEIQMALKELNKNLESAKLERSEAVKRINAIKKNIKFYEELDNGQIRMDGNGID